MVNLLIIDKKLGSGINGKIFRDLETILFYKINYNPNIDKIYIKVDNNENNKMNCIFDQDIDNVENIITQEENTTNPIRIDIQNVLQSPYYKEFKNLALKIMFSNKVYDIVKNYDKITNNTLAVHIRITDMDVWHSHGYKKITYNDYVIAINMVLNKYKNITDIFIASDNHESINKIISDFSNYNIHYFKTDLRVQFSNSDCYQFQLNNFKNENFYISSIIDTLLLSKCKYIIHRVSSVSWLAILLSNTLELSINIDKKIDSIIRL